MPFLVGLFLSSTARQLLDSLDRVGSRLFGSANGGAWSS
jgi:hypothetical protein